MDPDQTTPTGVDLGPHCLTNGLLNISADIKVDDFVVGGILVV